MRGYMAKISGVYEIVNTINGHTYIGSSVSIKNRWRGHKSDLRKNKHHSRYLQRAWNKYGSDCFEFNIIERCKKSQLIEREQHYIDTINPSYNMFPYARSPLGSKWSIEQRKNFRKARKGKPNPINAKRMRTVEARARVSALHKGKIVSEETRAKISEIQTGRKASDETKAKMRASARRGENNHKSKLTWEQVKEIRNRYIPRKVSQRKLASEFGVDQQVIWSIVNFKTWRIEQ
jgi:group I intron endonuclease